ncbi:MAG: SH3 domain-containing protein [Lachnospiraceae bacterium]|nr:SH3 domain-containing protein [Lachnospiraceae bacterium]
MRHNRKAVMAEQYKLYMKKNIFNGRYFVRNMQIGACVLLTILVVAVTVVLLNTKDDVKKTASKTSEIDAKDALFGNDADANAGYAMITDAVDDVIVTEDVTEPDTVEDTEAPTEAATDSYVGTATESVTEGIVEAAKEVEVPVEEEEEQGEFANRCIANVEETLNIRKDPSRDAEFVGSMQQGSIAMVEGAEGEWTKIKSGDVEGYVLTEYVLTGEQAEEFAKDYVTIQGVAKEDAVNIREDRSTDANILKVLNKDDTVSVLEVPEEDAETTEDSETVQTESVQTTEAATTETATVGVPAEAKTEVTTEAGADDKTEDKSDEIEWLTVMLEDGQIGYVSAEFIEVNRLYTLAVSAEELQRRDAAKAAAAAAAAQAALDAARQTANAAPASTSTYQGATTTPVKAAESGECIGTFTITAYCGCSKCSGGHSKTASGTTPTENRTIAADTSVLPYGTQVVIGGVVYTVEDCGSGVCGNHIDIFFSTHEKAVNFGTKTMKVYKY